MPLKIFHVDFSCLILDFQAKTNSNSTSQIKDAKYLHFKNKLIMSRSCVCVCESNKIDLFGCYFLFEFIRTHVKFKIEIFPMAVKQRKNDAHNSYSIAVINKMLFNALKNVNTEKKHFKSTRQYGKYAYLLILQ